MTTEKELDTVEVLKAIQKAKEVKDRMSSGDKKVRSRRRSQTCRNQPMGLNLWLSQCVLC